MIKYMQTDIINWTNNVEKNENYQMANKRDFNPQHLLTSWKEF